MKKIIFTLIFIFFACSLNAATVFGDALTAQTTPGTAVIDGKNTDGEWDNVTVYPINKFKPGTGIGPSQDFEANYRIKYDGSSIYVFIEVKDSTVSKKPGGVDVKQDRIQTYIDYSNAGSGAYSDPEVKAYQIALNRNGDFGQYDCPEYDLNNNFEIKVISTDTGYTVEYKCNLEGITGEKVTSNKTIGFDIQVSDNDTNSDTRLAAYGWNDDQDLAWIDLSALGKLTLVVSDGASPAPETSQPAATTEAPAGTEEPSNASTPDNMLLYVGIAVVVVVLIGVVVLVGKRKK